MLVLSLLSFLFILERPSPGDGPHSVFPGFFPTQLADSRNSHIDLLIVFLLGDSAVQLTISINHHIYLP